MEHKNIIEFKDYGKIELIIGNLMNKKNISVYKMSKLTGLKHQTVKAYHDNAPITRVDLDVLSKMCYVLDCTIADVLRYIPPKK